LRKGPITKNFFIGGGRREENGANRNDGSGEGGKVATEKVQAAWEKKCGKSSKGEKAKAKKKKTPQKKNSGLQVHS